MTWATYGRAIDEAAAGLDALGIEHGDRVAILSWNRPEWQEADLGTLSLGAISVPVYPTSAAPQVGYVLEHSASRVCFVEDAEQLSRVLAQRDRLPALEHVVVLGERVPQDDPLLLSFEGLRALGAQALDRDPDVVARARHSIKPDDVATIVYTSGTTGPPKGAVLTHANIMAMLRSVTALVPLSPADRFLSFLPLSHITERSVSHFGLIASGGETWFARSISTVAEDLPDCRPTIFFAVPRVWEKIREGVENRVGRLTGVRGRAARAYLSLAFRRARELETQKHMPFPTKLAWLALDRTVGAQLRAQLGLDRTRITVSGAAPIHPDLVRWFNGVGLPLAEGYGQTEVALATTMNPPGASRVGTVGPPLPGVSVRIADDGEILIKGENVCAGYWHDEDATHALIDEDGWLRSGDLGAFDDHGYLRITGRKKDLIITAHGKNISPQNIETDLAADPSDRPGRRDRRRTPVPHRAAGGRRDRGRRLGSSPQQRGRRPGSARAGSGPASRGRPRGRRDERPARARRAHPHLARAASLAHGHVRRADPDPEGQAGFGQRALRRPHRRDVRRAGGTTGDSCPESRATREARMKELDDLDPAMHAALDPLTTEERQMFSDDMDARFPDAPMLVTSDPSAAMERAWQLASGRLLSDPLDPVGEAWSRFAISLFSQ